MPLVDLPLEELRRYAPDLPEPADFDAFWRRTLDGAPPGPVLLDVRPESTDLRLLRTWDVTFAGWSGHPVRAWYTRPAGVDEVLPAVVEFVGYGRGRGLPHERLTWPVAGHAHLLMDCRGQGAQYGNGGATPDPERGAYGGPGPITRGILDPEQYYYRRLIADAVRAVAAVRELPGVDPRRVVAAGNSQGGGLALAVAGLVPDLAGLLSTAALMCHLQRAVELTDQGPYGELATFLSVHREAEPAVRRTLGYVDGVSFARRASAPAQFAVGLRDGIVPPRTVYAAYNQYGARSAAAGVTVPREIHPYPWNGHEHGDALHVARQLRWVADLTGGGVAGGPANGLRDVRSP